MTVQNKKCGGNVSRYYKKVNNQNSLSISSLRFYAQPFYNHNDRIKGQYVIKMMKSTDVECGKS